MSTVLPGNVSSYIVLPTEQLSTSPYTYALLAAQEQTNPAKDRSDIVNENEDAEDEL